MVFDIHRNVLVNEKMKNNFVKIFTIKKSEISHFMLKYFLESEKMDTLYLKYRPKKFGEVVWQDHVKKILANAIKNKKVSHSYLFSGPRGTGKTSVARILAKSINCLNPVDTYEPCNVCDSCVEIDSGNSLDVIEMDAASNRGIDEIRNVRDRVVYMPFHQKYKVYIIDEVHMLTKEAFNALLKTLEEPPEKTIFILATTEIQKVPETVLSRCQILEFRRIPVKVIQEKLVQICKSENIEYEQKALEHIAEEAAGGMRDAIGMLEEVSRFADGKITLKDTLLVLGESPIEIVENYVSSILDGNVESLINITESIRNRGIDIMNFLKNVVEYSSEKAEDRQFVMIGKFVIDLIQNLKYEERQFEIFKIMSVFEALKYKKEAHLPSTPENFIDKFVENFKNEDLSAYVSLKMSTLKDMGSRILVVSYVPLHKEILEEKSKEISEKFKNMYNRDVQFVIAYSKVPIDSMEDDLKEPVIKVLSLFGGKILPEEARNG